MRTPVLWVLVVLLFSPLLLPASFGTESEPVYGRKETGSILISVWGHGCEMPGKYHVDSSSLRAFLKKDQIKISRHVVDVKIMRKEGGETMTYMVRIKEISEEKDFELKDSDILLVATPYV